jgi:hypothetical protein
MTEDFTHEVCAAAHLGRADRDRMYALFDACYDRVSRGAFEADLSGKSSVVVMRDAAGEVRGFSTQEVYEHAGAGGVIRVLFSGDTVVDPSCWGRSELVHGWCEVAARALLSAPNLPLYWFLISKGHRTYRYLPVFFRHYIPGLVPDAPAAWRGLLDELARKRFGDYYDAHTGVIRFPESRGQLRAELATVPAARRDDPQVRYFLEHNPEYGSGVELACLAEVSLANTHGLGRRWLERAVHRAVASLAT